MKIPFLLSLDYTQFPLSTFHSNQLSIQYFFFVQTFKIYHQEATKIHSSREKQTSTYFRLCSHLSISHNLLITIKYTGL